MIAAPEKAYCKTSHQLANPPYISTDYLLSALHEAKIYASLAEAKCLYLEIAVRDRALDPLDAFEILQDSGALEFIPRKDAA